MAWLRLLLIGGSSAWELPSTVWAWETSRSVAKPHLKRDWVSFSTPFWDSMFSLVAEMRACRVRTTR